MAPAGGGRGGVGCCTGLGAGAGMEGGAGVVLGVAMELVTCGA